MVKGTKRQIIFLSDLKKYGTGLFECAYLILRKDNSGEFEECDMLAEADRIVAEAEKMRSGNTGKKAKRSRRSSDESHRERRIHSALFFGGFVLGAAAVLALFAVCHLF